jgi:hypothetical protein
MQKSVFQKLIGLYIKALSQLGFKNRNMLAKFCKIKHMKFHENRIGGIGTDRRTDGHDEFDNRFLQLLGENTLKKSLYHCEYKKKICLIKSHYFLTNQRRNESSNEITEHSPDKSAQNVTFDCAINL